MTPTDEQIMREALDSLWTIGDDNGNPGQKTFAEKALEALDRLMANTLPELPEGWMLKELTQFSGGFQAQLMRLNPTEFTHRYTGGTPRAAVMAALEKYK